MPGVRLKHSDLPEQPGELKVSRHWFFLVASLFLLGVVTKSLSDYFLLTGPPVAELYPVELTSVTNVVVEPEIPGSTRIDNIWLHTTGGKIIRYRDRFPYSEAVRRLDPDLSL